MCVCVSVFKCCGKSLCVCVCVCVCVTVSMYQSVYTSLLISIYFYLTNSMYQYFVVRI